MLEDDQQVVAARQLLSIRRAAGRRLQDFQDQPTSSGLLPAEDRLLQQCRVGEPCTLGNWTVAGASDSRQSDDDQRIFEIVKRVVLNKDDFSLAADDLPSAQKAAKQCINEFKEYIEAHGYVCRTSPADQDLNLDLLQTEFSSYSRRFYQELQGWRSVEPSDDAACIRASFLRFLLLGGDDNAPVHEKGVQLVGAYISGTLDCEHSVLERSLLLRGCLFQEPIIFTDATASTLELRGCYVKGILAERARVSGGIHLSDGFTCSGEANLSGIRIAGDLTCRSGTFSNGKGRSLNIEGGHIDGGVYLTDGFLSIGSIWMPGVAVDGELICSGARCINSNELAIVAEGAQIGRDVLLGDGFLAAGTSWFLGSRIRGQLVCRGGRFINPGNRVLIFENSEIKGGAFLYEGFYADGEVRLVGARIDSQLECRGASFFNPGGVCLAAEGAEIRGGVYLSHGFQSEGEIQFLGARIKNYLALQGGQFRNARKPAGINRIHIRDFAEDSINLQSARVDGVLYISPAAAPHDKPVKIEGSLRLQGAYVATLALDLAALPSDRVEQDRANDQSGIVGDKPQFLDCLVILDGFTFDHLEIRSLASEGPPDAVAAIQRLLSRQPSTHRGSDFRPQPYEHAVALFKKMGRDDEAKKIAALKARARRSRYTAKNRKVVTNGLARKPAGPILDRIGAFAWLLWPIFAILVSVKWLFGLIGRAASWLAMDWFLGQGFDRSKPAIAFVVFTFVGAWFYSAAADQGVFVPADKMFVQNPDVRRLCAGASGVATSPEAHINWYKCKVIPDGYTAFHPFIYSLDLMIPFGSLGPRRDWRVDEAEKFSIRLWGFSPVLLSGQIVERVSIGQTYAAIGLYTILIAFLTGAIRKE
jgi:hypothetical protein